MSPEEAYAVQRRIDALKRIGEEIMSERYKSPSELRSDSDYKLEGWFGEVESLIKSNFEGNTAFVSRITEIKNGRIEKDDRALETPEKISSAIDLLETVKDFVFIDPHGSASDSLKDLIEQTLKERYFRSWEVWALAGTFTLVLILFLGGTVYLGMQVKGVAEQADAARSSIETERASVVTIGNDIVKKIEANATERANAQIAKLNTAIEQSASNITGLNTQLTNNRAALDQQLTDGQKRIKTTIDDAVAQAPSNANAYLEFKKPAIDAKIKEEVEVKVKNAGTKIDDQINYVEIRKKNFEDALPETMKYAENRTKEFNDIVSRYSDPIAQIISRLSGSQNLSSIEAVARVLGNAFWLAVGAGVLAVIAFFFSLRAWFR